MKRWIFIDVSYLAHKARHTMKGLSFEDLPTGVIYGFFESLLTICNDQRLNSNRVAMFLDSRQSLRRDKFSWYKEKRQKDKIAPEDWAEMQLMRKQLKCLRKEILPSVGFPVFHHPGLESDDLIAQAAKQVHEAGQGATIVTADRDLYQCITLNVDWFDPTQDKYVTAAKFFYNYGIDPPQWGMVKQIAGCTSDDVPGIDGVGDKTAIKYILNKLPKHHKTYGAICCPDGQKIIKRNKEVVVLPHKATPTLELKEPDFKPDVFFDWCKKLGIRTYLEAKRRTWEGFFKGEVVAPESRQKPRHRTLL